MKKGDNSEKKQKFKKVKDTILRYFDIAIYVKISASFVKRCTLKSDARQTNTQTNTETNTQKKHTYRVKTFYLQVFILFSIFV